MSASGGGIVQYAPQLYPTIDGAIDGVRQNVSGQFVLEGPNTAGYAVGAFDPTNLNCAPSLPPL